MTTETEQRSYELIDEMTRLEQAARASFKETDALIKSLGLTRESLAPTIEAQRARLSKAQLKELQRYEQRFDEPVVETPRRPTSYRIQLGLINRI